MDGNSFGSILMGLSLDDDDDSASISSKLSSLKSANSDGTGVCATELQTELYAVDEIGGALNAGL